MRSLALAGALLLTAALVGCNMTSSSMCVSWVDFATPADAAADAQVVVVGNVIGPAPSRELFYVDAPVHRFAVESVLKGDAPSEIDVASVPQTCNGEAGAFPEGDPLETSERIELFLFVEDGEYRLITPWDGVAPAPEGQPLPWQPEG